MHLFVTEYDEFRRDLIRRNCHRALTQYANDHIDVALVKEFYANLYDPEDKSPRQCQVQVRGKLIKFDGEMLNAFLETPLIIQPGEQYTAYSLFCRSHPDPQEFAAKLCILGHRFVLNAEGAPWKLLRMDLMTLAQTWSILSYYNLHPTSHTSDLNMDMDVGSFISGQISQMA